MICTSNRKLLAITAQPRKLSWFQMISVFLARSGNHLPSGARYDVYAFRFHQLERFLDDTTLANKGYIGLGLLTPVKLGVWATGETFNKPQ